MRLAVKGAIRYGDDTAFENAKPSVVAKLLLAFERDLHADAVAWLAPLRRSGFNISV